MSSSAATMIVKSSVSARPATRQGPTRSLLPSSCPASSFLALRWPRLAPKGINAAAERCTMSTTTTTTTTKASPSKSTSLPLARAKARSQRSLRGQTVGAATGDSALSLQDETNDLLPLRAAFARVVLPLALALCLCNADRICLAVAIVPMSSELGWTPSTQGVVQSSFLVGYAATQLLGGRLADRLGGRVVLGSGIAFFSLAQLATPALLALASGGGGGGAGSSAAAATAAAAAAAVSSRTLAAALFARAAVGLGEGVALPSMSSLVAAHVPRSSRATALGASFSGFHCGNLLGLALSPVLLAKMGWRGMFAFFGLAGAPLLLLWFALVPSPMRKKKKEKEKEKNEESKEGEVVEGTRSLIESSSPSSSTSSPSSSVASSTSSPPPPSPRALLSSRHTWAIIAANVANHWGYFVYLSWLPSYFYRVLGLNLAASSAASLGPWLLMAAGSSASGALADWLVRSKGWSVRRTRVTLQLVAFLVPAAALAVLVLAGGGGGGGGSIASSSSTTLLHPAAAIALVATALGTTSLGQAGFVANMADVAPRAAGSMFGLCNTFGSAAGIAGVVGAGWIVEKTGGSFAPLFLLTAGLYCVGAAVFASFASGEAVF